MNQLAMNSSVSEEFVGVNVTESFVEHFRNHDTDEAECGTQIKDILDMWGEKSFEFFSCSLVSPRVKCCTNRHFITLLLD